jgi:hypothetical protein
MPGFVNGLLIACIIVEMTISGNLLNCIGIPYTTEGGSFLTKLHPGTYLSLLGFSLLLFCRTLSRRVSPTPTPPYLSLYLAAICACIAFGWLANGAGNVVALVESFLPAGTVGYMLVHATEPTRRRVRRLLQVLIALNIWIAIPESLIGSHLVPSELADVTADGKEFRPLALFDHPLTGATVALTGLFIAPSAPMALRIAYFTIIALGLVAFGGRTAFVVAVAAAGLWTVLPILRIVARRRYPALDLLRPALFCSTALLIGLMANSAGIGDRLFSHFYWDSSADVRIGQWQVISLMDWPQFAFGVSRPTLLSLQPPGERKRWPAKFGQRYKWKPCLKAASMPRIRSNHGTTSTADA